MVKPEKFGHLHLVCHFTVPLGKKKRQYDTELARLKLIFNIKNKLQNGRIIYNALL